MKGRLTWLKAGRGAWLAAVVTGVLLCIGCSPASVAFREGRKAEEQNDYDNAVIHFQKALQYQPNNAHFLIYDRVARSKASILHEQRGRRLLAEGQPDAAAGEFQKAISIDPGNQAAGQELQSILLKQSAAATRREQAIRKSMERAEAAQGATGVKLQPLPQQAITHLQLSADSRRVFETLAKLAGINVVFYYNFQPKPVSLDLSNVTIGQALRAAAAEADVFWKPISHNTLLIIPDTPSNRRELEPQVLRTIYLQNPLTPTDRTAILTAVEHVTGVIKAFENPDTNSITIYDTPEKVAAAEKLIHDLDRGKAEVLINVTVLEADRDRLRDLGLSPVPISGDTMAAIGLTPPAASSTTSSPSTTPTSSVGLNQLGKLTTGQFG
ncbi:MAG: tetratricopeptide repeat protein, partial [Terriglobia bacterium]